MIQILVIAAGVVLGLLIWAALADGAVLPSVVGF